VVSFLHQQFCAFVATPERLHTDTRFDASDADGVYAFFSDESKKLLDRDRFIAKLTAAWRTANALLADAATARSRPARGTRKRLNWRIYTRSQKFEVSSMQTAAAIGCCNSALAHKSTWSHMVITRIGSAFRRAAKGARSRRLGR
jgi:hypothetical protein